MHEVINNNIYQLRTAENITQEELAAAVGVTRQTIIAMEKGNYVPSIALALKLAAYFKKSVDDVFTLTYER